LRIYLAWVSDDAVVWWIMIVVLLVSNCENNASLKMLITNRLKRIRARGSGRNYPGGEGGGVRMECVRQAKWAVGVLRSAVCGENLKLRPL